MELRFVNPETAAYMIWAKFLREGINLNQAEVCETSRNSQLVAKI